MKFIPVSLVMSLLLAAPVSARINYLRTVSNGALTGQGRSDTSDNITPRGRYYDAWIFRADAGSRISVVVESSDFDTVAVVTTADRDYTIASNDDINSETTNSQVIINVTRSSDFAVGVLARDGSGLGNYAVRVRNITAAQPTETSDERSARIREQTNRLNRMMGGGSEMNTNSPNWNPF